MSSSIGSIQKSSVITPNNPTERTMTEGEIEVRTTHAAISAVTTTAAESIHTGGESATRAEPIIRAEIVEVLEHPPREVPGFAKGISVAVTQPVATGHIDEVLFAKQTRTEGAKTFWQKTIENPLFPFADGKYILNVTKALGKYGVLFTIVDWVKPRIQQALPNNVPCKDIVAMAATATIAGVAETLVTAPMSVCIAAKRSDRNEGKTARTCPEIFRGVEPRKRLGHFFPKEVIKWNGARNVLFAVPLFVIIDPIKEVMKSALGFSKKEEIGSTQKMLMDTAATGIASSGASLCSFWADTIATRCTQKPGLNGADELTKILAKEGLFGTVKYLNYGLPKVFLRMGIAGAVIGGVTSGLGIGYQPAKEYLQEALEDVATRLARLNPTTDLVTESPAEALDLGGQASSEKDVSSFLSSMASSARSFLSSLLTQSSKAASNQALFGDDEWTSSGDYTEQAPSPVAETSIPSADSNEALLASEAWVPPSTGTETAPSPVSYGSASSRNLSDYVSDANF